MPRYPLVGGWLGPRASLDTVEKRKFLARLGLKLRTLSHPAQSAVAVPTVLSPLRKKSNMQWKYWQYLASFKLRWQFSRHGVLASPGVSTSEIYIYIFGPYQWQILNPSGKRKAKKNFTVSVKTPNGTGERYFERYYRSGSSSWFHEITMHGQAFMSIKCMRAGHTSLKASLNGFGIVSMAECECGDELQTLVLVL
jgi:hypothetical protein